MGVETAWRPRPITRIGGPTYSLRAKLWLASVSIGLTAAVMVTVGEAYLRLTRSHASPDTHRAKSLEYEATLFARHAFPRMVQKKRATPSGYVEISERGYRGRSFEVPKPPGVIRLVVLGGSAAFDMYAKEGRDWPHLIEEYLRAQGHTNVEVINAGTPGHATFDSLGRLYSELWTFEPDYVLVYHAWNDIKYFHRLDSQTTLLRTQRPAMVTNDGGRPMVSNPFIYYWGPADRLLSYSELYVRLRSQYLFWRIGKPGSEGVVTDVNTYASTYSAYGPRQYGLNLHLIMSAARHIRARGILATQARLVTQSNTPAEKEKIAYELVELSPEALLRAFEDSDRAIFKVAQANDVPVLDLSGIFTGRSELFEDHVHTTAAGSEALARATAEFLRPMIGRR